ncbi:MAG: GNAT family N-acetyltransferase [Bacteroidota bacterium]
MKIIRASSEFLNELIPLFDAYRVFYQQSSDLPGARRFLEDRFARNESIIFMAVDSDGKGVGFTQLYPSFSSVSMQPMHILNDLYVDPQGRGKGIGAALMRQAQQYAREQGCKSLVLETAVDNPAQKLYKRLGWAQDVAVNHYTWTV